MMTDSTPPKDQQAEDTTISLTEVVTETPFDTTVTPETPILQNAQTRGGTKIADHELEELSYFTKTCEVQDISWSGSDYSWTNKTIRSRIDRAFCNAYWWETFDYTHNKYLVNALSDHTVQFLHFPTSIKPKPSFQYCDIWSRHENFWPTINSVAPITGTSPSLQQIGSLLAQIRAKLRLFNRDHFADLRSQQGKARITMETVQQALQTDPRNEHLLQKEKEARDRYIAILSSSLCLMQQKSKMEWITQGDLSTRFFFAKVKQRKLSTYIYAIKDDHGKQVEGFEEIRAIMMNFYKGLLGEHPTCRSSLKQEILFGGISHTLQTECLHITGLKEGCFPLKYLEVPITTSKLTKLECRSLLEKITTRVKTWASRNLSFVGRAVLINNVLFGMLTNWASIFILPSQVIDKLSRIYRNYLWEGSADSRRIPHVAWHQVYLPKTQGGLGLKDYNAWNKALIGKLVWAVAHKKDILWVKWIHGRYMKNQVWWDYSPSPDSSWYWMKIHRTNEVFKLLCPHPPTWEGGEPYKVTKGYTCSSNLSHMEYKEPSHLQQQIDTRRSCNTVDERANQTEDTLYESLLKNKYRHYIDGLLQ
ncbi:hypothetical protein Cgig2_022606 [Carnegiea gigantea]|uniref:Uncharacterized protein n=1 Tax=Carnegiea gigantea TaxID=171969 RepID=A0A9Q1GXB7_9CARY|nr:hypothetical protein Cgig2_022606 [Carnegiea gigantea]